MNLNIDKILNEQGMWDNYLKNKQDEQLKKDEITKRVNDEIAAEKAAETTKQINKMNKPPDILRVDNPEEPQPTTASQDLMSGAKKFQKNLKIGDQYSDSTGADTHFKKAFTGLKDSFGPTQTEERGDIKKNLVAGVKRSADWVTQEHPGVTSAIAGGMLATGLALRNKFKKNK